MKSVKADLGAMPPRQQAQDDLAASILRVALFFGDGWSVIRPSFEIATIEVVEGRNGQQQSRVERPHPGKIDVAITLPFEIANAGGLRICVIGYLIEIPSSSGHEPELVDGRGVIDEGGKSTEAVTLIMQHLRSGRRQPVIAAVAVEAGEVGEAFGVATEADLVVAL